MSWICTICGTEHPDDDAGKIARLCVRCGLRLDAITAERDEARVGRRDLARQVEKYETQWMGLVREKNSMQDERDAIAVRLREAIERNKTLIADRDALATDCRQRDERIVRLVEAAKAHRLDVEGFAAQVAKVEAERDRSIASRDLAERILLDMARERDAVVKERDEAQKWGEPRLARHQPCGCVVCTCEDQVQCQGCGGHNCGLIHGWPPPNAVWEPHPLVAERDALRAEVERLHFLLVRLVATGLLCAPGCCGDECVCTEVRAEISAGRKPGEVK